MFTKLQSNRIVSCSTDGNSMANVNCLEWTLLLIMSVFKIVNKSMQRTALILGGVFSTYYF
jgi:hypothetical protein